MVRPAETKLQPLENQRLSSIASEQRFRPRAINNSESHDGGSFSRNINATAMRGSSNNQFELEPRAIQDLRKGDDMGDSIGLPSVGGGSARPDYLMQKPESLLGSSTGASHPETRPLTQKLNQVAAKEEQANEGNALLNEKFQKYSRDSELYEQTPMSMLRTIINFIASDITKKQRSFKIGVFTVFLVVMFISLLKSIVDVAPIAFLKVGQD